MKIISANPQPNLENNTQLIKPIKGSAKLIKKTQLSDHVYEFTFEMVEPTEIHFKSGQYIAIQIDSKTRRQYSISSAPQNKNQFQLVIDVKPNGFGVNHLMNLEKNDQIIFIGQIGLFVLPQTLDQDLYFVSTGTGLAPLKSMIEDLIANDLYRNHRINVIFGTRYENDIFYKEIFNEYLEQGLINEYKIYLSKPEEIKDDFEQGYVTKYFENLSLKDLNDSQIYICGSGAMIKSLEEMLLEKGLPQEKIIYEKFY